jgi:hypothetical protein
MCKGYSREILGSEGKDSTGSKETKKIPEIQISNGSQYKRNLFAIAIIEELPITSSYCSVDTSSSQKLMQEQTAIRRR